MTTSIVLDASTFIAMSKEEVGGNKVADRFKVKLNR